MRHDEGLAGNERIDSARPSMPKMNSLEAAHGGAPATICVNPVTVWAEMAAATANATGAMMRSGLELGFHMMRTAQSYWGEWYSYLENMSTDAKIREWVREDAKDWMRADTKEFNQEKADALEAQGLGTSPSGRYYTHTKNEMQTLLAQWQPFTGDALKDQLMHNARIQEAMRSPAMAEQFRKIDARVRAIYEEMYPAIYQKMRKHGTLYDAAYNHKFLTEESHNPKTHGNIVAMDVDDIVKLFNKRAPKGAIKGEHFPHIIITTSHAQGETLEDVRSITHGIEAMARDSEGKDLPHGYVDKAVKAGDTLTLYACDVEETPWLNGQSLLDRVNELKRIAKTGKPDTEFHHISPGAKRIAKLMLKCMVEDPSLIDVNAPDGMAVVAKKRNTPIILREDAVEIAHHFQLIGYSKGGNVVSDAMRYLVAELTATRENGQTVFEKHPDSHNRAHDVAMSEHNVRDIVRSIATLALASVETGMSAHDIAHGVRRDAVNSEEDLISAHKNYESNPPYDRRWIIKGVKEHLGHAPHSFMGKRDLGVVGEKIVGFVHDSPVVARRLREFFASNYGKVAISQVAFGEYAAQGEVKLEAATGTTNSQIEKLKNSIIAAVGNAFGLGAHALKTKPHRISLTADEENAGMFSLIVKGKDFKNNREDIATLKQAFAQLRADKDNGLAVAQTITGEGLAKDDAASDFDKQLQSITVSPDMPKKSMPAMMKASPQSSGRAA
jgi:hypothetical protein